MLPSAMESDHLAHRHHSPELNGDTLQPEEIVRSFG